MQASLLEIKQKDLLSSVVPFWGGEFSFDVSSMMIYNNKAYAIVNATDNARTLLKQININLAFSVVCDKKIDIR